VTATSITSTSEPSFRGDALVPGSDRFLVGSDSGCGDGDTSLPRSARYPRGTLRGSGKCCSSTVRTASGTITESPYILNAIAT
jgi:hypothetical protein